MKKFSGFTLIELMVTVALVAIVLTIGVPSFSQFIQSNRATSKANEFLAALTFARSEAIKRGNAVVVCATGDPAADPPACVGDAVTDWSSGWLIFTDEGANVGDYENGAETLLRVHESVQNTVFVSDGPGTGGLVRFGGDGLALVDDDFTMRPTGCDTNSLFQRSIDMTPTGRASVTTEACP